MEISRQDINNLRYKLDDWGDSDGNQDGNSDDIAHELLSEYNELLYALIEDRLNQVDVVGKASDEIDHKRLNDINSRQSIEHANLYVSAKHEAIKWQDIAEEQNKALVDAVDALNTLPSDCLGAVGNGSIGGTGWFIKDELVSYMKKIISKYEQAIKGEKQ